MPYRFSGVFNHSDMRDLARRRLPRAIFEYIDFGSEEGVALRDNRVAIERIKFRPRTTVDVSQRDQSITLFGKVRKMPIVIAPTGGPEDRMIFGSLAHVQALLNKPDQLSLIEVSALCKDCPIGDIVAQISELVAPVSALGGQQALVLVLDTLHDAGG